MEKEDNRVVVAGTYIEVAGSVDVGENWCPIWEGLVGLGYEAWHLILM